MQENYSATGAKAFRLLALEIIQILEEIEVENIND